jgi:hypothetical protein
MSSTYQPSTSDRVREQVALYEATDGREGGTLEGRPVVILTTTGAKTGNIRKNNVIAHPEVSLQDGATVYRMRAREIPVMLLEPIETSSGQTQDGEG